MAQTGFISLEFLRLKLLTHMKNESKAFKVGKLQKEEKLCFHLIDVGFLILSPLLSLLLVLADIKQHCLVLI